MSHAKDDYLTEEEVQNLDNKVELGKELDSLKEKLAAAENDLAAAKDEVNKLKEQIIYSAAEEENIRKRNLKQLDEAKKFAVTNFSKEMIDVLENLYLATANIPNEMLAENEVVNSIFQGIEMTKSSLINIFAKHGIVRVYPEVGEMFDHNLHEAVTYVESPDHQDNSIVSVMRAGYLLHDRLIKPAMVVLAKSKQ